MKKICLLLLGAIGILSVSDVKILERGTLFPKYFEPEQSQKRMNGSTVPPSPRA